MPELTWQHCFPILFPYMLTDVNALAHTAKCQRYFTGKFLDSHRMCYIFNQIIWFLWDGNDISFGCEIVATPETTVSLSRKAGGVITLNSARATLSFATESGNRGAVARWVSFPSNYVLWSFNFPFLVRLKFITTRKCCGIDDIIAMTI